MKVIDYLNEYNKKNIYPFHMPGNKRQGEFNQLDFTEVEDLDNLYHPEGIYKESLDRIKNLYSTKESYILVNGSTVGISLNTAPYTSAAPARPSRAFRCRRPFHRPLRPPARDR